MSQFELVDESEEKTHADWLRSLAAVEGARSLALLRLAELCGSTTTKKKRSEAAEALERTAAELHMLLGDDASSSGNPDDGVINTLVANSVLVLKHRSLSAWEDIHRVQRLFWLALASFAPSTLQATTEKRRQVLIEHALNPDHLVQLASNRGEGRSAWLPSRHPAGLRQSCEYVSMMFHTIDLLSGVAIDCLEGKRALQRSPSPTANDSPPISRRGTRAARDGPTAAPSVSLRKLSLLAGQPSLFVPLGPRYQAEVPAFAPHEEVLERGDELLVIDHVPAAPPQRPPPAPSSALKSEEEVKEEEEGAQPMDEDEAPLSGAVTPPPPPARERAAPAAPRRERKPSPKLLASRSSPPATPVKATPAKAGVVRASVVKAGGARTVGVVKTGVVKAVAVKAIRRIPPAAPMKKLAELTNKECADRRQATSDQAKLRAALVRTAIETEVVTVPDPTATLLWCNETLA